MEKKQPPDISEMHVCQLMHWDAAMGLMAVGVMHACFEAEAMPLYAILFMVMELLPGGIVARQHRAHSTVEVYFKVEIWGISGALEAEKWKESSSV